MVLASTGCVSAIFFADSPNWLSSSAVMSVTLRRLAMAVSYSMADFPAASATIMMGCVTLAVSLSPTDTICSPTP